MRGILQALTFLVILAVAGFIVLAVIGAVQERSTPSGDDATRAAARVLPWNLVAK